MTEEDVQDEAVSENACTEPTDEDSGSGEMKNPTGDEMHADGGR